MLTRCLVKYALKELLQDKTADDILQLTVCEPAMGSAAFLNEAVNQLAEAYLERKQAELNRRIPHDEYPRELQRVRMVLADRNVFGVDLNPVAVELAEVSLWLNAIYGQPDKDGDGNPLPLRPARVPWFGYQLFAGNSLIGARREVFRAGSLKKGAKPAWHEEAPRRLNVQRPDRAADEIYHFLLPDPGMAKYTDKVAKGLYAEDFERLSRWRKEFCRPLEDHELSRLQQLSARIDELWAEHTQWLARDRARTEDDLTVWPAAESDAPNIPRREKEAIRRQGLFNEDGDLATPFRRLKLVMDYWCALWFWPIQKSADLPTREQWWMEVGAVLEGNIVDVAPQAQIDFAPEPAPQVLVPKPQPTLEGFDSQLRLAATAETEPARQARAAADQQASPAFSTGGAGRGNCGHAAVHALGAVLRRCSRAARWIRSGAWQPTVDQGRVERGRHSRREEPAVCDPQDQRVGSAQLARRGVRAVSWTAGCLDGRIGRGRRHSEFLERRAELPAAEGRADESLQVLHAVGWRLAGAHGVTALLAPGRPVRRPERRALAGERCTCDLRAHFQFHE